VNVLHIAWRELRAMFTTAIGWLVLCGWLLITGLFWVLMVQNYVSQSEDLVFNPYGAQHINLTDWLLVPFFGNCAVVLIMVAPALSMRLFSEEMKQRTLELLMTSPVSTLEIVLGKFLGALAFVAILLLGTLQFPLGLLQWGSPDPGVVGGGYLALLLLGSALLSLGMFTSSLTSNQVVASVLSFAVALGLLVVSWGSQSPDDLYAEVSLMTHLDGLMRGAVKLSDVAYYLAFSAFFLFATHQRMESFRWR
jgi:ABC-2 type transport system permease protein